MEVLHQAAHHGIMSANGVRGEAETLRAEYLAEARDHDTRAAAAQEKHLRQYHAETAEALRWIAGLLSNVRDGASARMLVDRLMTEMSIPQPEGKFAAMDEAVLRLEEYAVPLLPPRGGDRDRHAAVDLLRSLLSAEDQAALRKQIAADPHGWHGSLHFGLGMAVRNTLREHGFTADSLGMPDLDTGWPHLVEKAVAIPTVRALGAPRAAELAVYAAPPKAKRHWTAVGGLIEAAPAWEFYFGSPVLEQAWWTQHPEIVRALVWRHQALGNKSAPSARALRHVIKHHDGRDFALLWQLFDASDEDSGPVHDHPATSSWLWAVANILGETGGARVIGGLHRRLLDGNHRKDTVLVRMSLHLALRYRDVLRDDAPMAYRLDVATEKYSQVPLAELGVESCDKVRLWRRVDDEFFVPSRYGGALADLLGEWDEDLIESVIDAYPYVPGTDHIVERTMGMHLKEAREKGHAFIIGAMESIPRPHGIRSRFELLEALRAIG